MRKQSKYPQLRLDLFALMDARAVLAIAEKRPHTVEQLDFLADERVRLAGRCLRGMQLEKRLRFNAVIGVPQTGDRLAAVLAEYTGTLHLSFASPKILIPSWVRKVAVVSDLVTTADPERVAVERLRKEGVEVIDVIALIDCDRGGREELSRCNCQLYSVFSINEFV